MHTYICAYIHTYIHTILTDTTRGIEITTREIEIPNVAPREIAEDDTHASPPAPPAPLAAPPPVSAPAAAASGKVNKQEFTRIYTDVARLVDWYDAHDDV